MPAIPSPNTVLIPLSPLDQFGGHNSGIVYGYVLDTTQYDSVKLDSAVNRVIRKWRLLAGRLEYDYTDKTWCIRVPLGDLPNDYKTHLWTTAQSTAPIGVPLVHVSRKTATTIQRPPLSAFRHPSFVGSLSGLAKGNLPILSIHVATFADCTCVGINAPHGVFDATGLGQIVHALDAELNGRSWEPPSLPPSKDGVNPFRDVILDMQRSVPAKSDDDCKCLNYIKRDYVPISFGNIVGFATRFGRENWWHKLEDRAVYLGPEIVQKIVKEVKLQAKEESGTAEWVSTNDTLVAWLAKAAYSNPESLKSANQVSIQLAVSYRPVLARSLENPEFTSYTHNTVVPCVLPLISVKDIHQMPLSTLALEHRRVINEVRTPEFLGVFSRWVKTMGGAAVPARGTGDTWLFSSQTVAGLHEIDWSGQGGDRVETFSFWFFLAPIAPDHAITLNKFKGGYLLQGNVRASRWPIIERALERLR